MKDVWNIKYDYYANGDVRVNINDSILDFVAGLNKDNVDFAAVMYPLTEALSIITNSISKDFDQNKDEKNARYQYMNREDLLLAVNRKSNKNGFSSIIEKIEQSIKDAKKALNVIKQKEQIDLVARGTLKEEMLSDVIRRYKYALDWMTYMEHVLNETAKDTKQAIENINNIDTQQTSKHEDRGFGYASYSISPEEKKTLIKHVRVVQQIMTNAENIYGKIIQKAYKGLDAISDELLKLAERSGIIVNDSVKEKRSNMIFFGIDKDIVGNVNGGYYTTGKKIL